MFRAFIQRLRQRNPADLKKALTMRQVFSVTKVHFFPTWRQWEQLPSLLSGDEKKIMVVAGIVFIFSIISLVGGYIFAHRIEVPAVGGEYTEGVIGEPQFINPLYASSNDVDQDLSSLIYSGLLRWDPVLGYTPDLAESMTVNEDATMYTFKIRDNAKFHNGDEVRARDVLFTINAIQNPSYRSPLIDVFHKTRVVQDDDKTVSFILEEPFAPFVQRLTVGILPSAVWAEILPQNAPLTALNLQPIGSGPFMFDEFAKDKRGSIRSYSLKRNHAYYRQAPFIETLTFKFYPDTIALSDALENKNVVGAGIIAFDEITKTQNNTNVILVEPLFPKETILYFNQSVNTTLADAVVRNAIASAINKQAIVDEVLQGHVIPLHGPVPEGMPGFTKDAITIFDPAVANAALDEAGYERFTNGMRKLKGETATSESDDAVAADPKMLSFTLTAAATTEMHAVAQALQQNLFTIGITLNLQFIAPDLLFTQTVEPRGFELLLTSVVFEGDPDLYAFWHSSQAKAGGLNFVGYNNKDVDTLILEARKEKDESLRAQKYQEISSAIVKDAPAVFLYQSRYAFAVSEKVHFTAPELILSPSDRFANIESWYIKTKKALR
jgi:peptide/nickel transport system substrate-binding protein